MSKLRPSAAVLAALTPLPLFLLSCVGSIDPHDAPAGPADTPEPPGGRPAGSSGSTGPGPAGAGGEVERPPLPVGAPSVCAVPSPSRLRRLTRTEYDNTIAALLGDTSRPARAFLPDEVAHNFDNSAEVLTVSELLAEQHFEVAEAIATRAIRDLPALLGCAPEGAAEGPCVRRFLERFARKAWRRPLSAEDHAFAEGVFTRARRSADVATSLRMAVHAVLSAPEFLYRTELAGAEGDAARLGPHELAARLSYLLWGGPPDEALELAADGGRLDTAAGLEAEARRLLEDPRAHKHALDFRMQWFGLAELEEVEKDPKVYPTFTGSIRKLMRAEAERFLELAGPSEAVASMGTLLTATSTFLNGPLAAFYGVSGVSGDGLRRVELDPRRRAGLLSLGALLTVNALTNESAPIRRGVFVREALLCAPPAPPPEALEIKPPDPDPRLTTRQRFDLHTKEPVCAGCHALIDPIGFGFENYDGVGRWRDHDNGQPVDASGELRGSDVDGPFVGLRALGEKLAGSREVAACAATQFFRWAHGREPRPEDVCTLGALMAALQAAKGDLRALPLAYIGTDSFRFRFAQRLGGTP
jgi:hypothetical protein